MCTKIPVIYISRSLKNVQNTNSRKLKNFFFTTLTSWLFMEQITFTVTTQICHVSFGILGFCTQKVLLRILIVSSRRYHLQAVNLGILPQEGFQGTRNNREILHPKWFQVLWYKTSFLLRNIRKCSLSQSLIDDVIGFIETSLISLHHISRQNYWSRNFLIL